MHAGRFGEEEREQGRGERKIKFLKFDEFSLLPPEHSFRAEPRRDHLSPTAPGALGKPQLLLPGREGTRQGSPGTSWTQNENKVIQSCTFLRLRLYHRGNLR